MKEKPIVQFTDLFFSYDKVPILENVNIKIFPGEFIGIIGPNGGGKTTLLKLIMGFLKPIQGTITREDLKIGYVPQTNRLDKLFPITVFELVLMGIMDEARWFGKFSKENKEKAYQALERLQLLPHADKTFGSLSGGLAQRALIARALVSDPEILLLDEPTASIDTETKKKIYEILGELKGTITILMVTHDLNIAIEKVERILMVEKSVSSLTPKEVCKHFGVGLYHTPLKELK
ncbi:MAG TPA: ABC transporter ATP-binding protein [Chlamydiales bacterium]|nr:ABC transporter ATP-binding protein [Chlamydiales bacterium]